MSEDSEDDDVDNDSDEESEEEKIEEEIAPLSNIELMDWEDIVC